MSNPAARRRRTPALAVLFVALGASALVATGKEMTDPDRQGDMFKRIFSYDKDLRRTDKIVMIVVSESENRAEAEKVADVFRGKGLFPAVVGVNDLSDDLTATLTPEGTVIYVMPGVAYDRVKEYAAAKGFLTISGVASLAEAGHVSVSVDVREGKPAIVVNMPRLQSERHELSSELLNLARVIR